MTNKSLAGIAVFMVVTGLVAVSNRAAPSPTAPASVSQQSPPALVVFKDPLTGLSTSDVRDARGHLVQFTTASELVWTADGTHLPGHYVSGPGYQPVGNI